MLMGRRHNLLAVFCCALLVCSLPQVTTGGEGERLPKVGEPFRDCPECPLMVRVPGGTFQKGSAEQSRHASAIPVRQMALPEPLAIGVYEVTFDEWDACLQAGGCRDHRLDDNGWGRGARPAINLHWEDAQSYVVWLRERTGRGYRLLTETEWEYAARARTVTKYSWGDEIGSNQANCSGCGSPWDGDWTAPVGSFPPNLWGLHDMHGNLWELVGNCWSDGDLGALLKGSECKRRVVRGGGWNSPPDQIASSTRTFHRYASHFNSNARFGHYVNVGFRVGLALTWRPPEVEDNWSQARIAMALGLPKAQEIDVEHSFNLPIPFVHGAPDLAPGARRWMRTLAAILSSDTLADHHFRVIGQGGSFGDAQYNRELAQMRAHAVWCRLRREPGIPHRRLFVGSEEETAFAYFRGELLTTEQLLPKVAVRQPILVVAKPNLPRNSEADPAASERWDDRYKEWWKMHGWDFLEGCGTFKDGHVRYSSHEGNDNYMGSIHLLFQDAQTLHNLSENSREFLLKVASDAGLTPANGINSLLKKENDRLFGGSKPGFSGQKPLFCAVFGRF